MSKKYKNPSGCIRSYRVHMLSYFPIKFDSPNIDMEVGTLINLYREKSLNEEIKKWIKWKNNKA